MTIKRNSLVGVEFFDCSTCKHVKWAFESRNGLHYMRLYRKSTDQGFYFNRCASTERTQRDSGNLHSIMQQIRKRCSCRNICGMDIVINHYFAYSRHCHRVSLRLDR